VGFEAVDLEAVVIDACATVPPQSLSVSVCDDAKPIVADENPLTQLSGNLFGNAVEHAGPETTVRVGTLDAVTGSTSRTTGREFPRANANRCSNTATRIQDNGTGFGLSIVERIVKVSDCSDEAVRLSTFPIEPSIAGSDRR
jgi:nitrogen fixation/metabolism regulation signal transduction histidine kinase